MKYLNSIISILIFISCNSTTNQNDNIKSSNDLESAGNTHLTAFDSSYIGTWESEIMTRDDDERINDPRAKTYLRITKSDEYYRVELKPNIESEYKPLEFRFSRLFGKSNFIDQVEDHYWVDNFLTYSEETNRLKYESRKMYKGNQEKGTVTIIYHRFK